MTLNIVSAKFPRRPSCFQPWKAKWCRTSALRPARTRQPKCPTNFVGAVALAKYSVRQRNGHPARHFSLRERVTTIDQHPDFPRRGVYERTAHVVKGTITDVQLFGYDEASLPMADKRRSAKPRRKYGESIGRSSTRTMTKDVRNHSVEA